MAKWTKFFDMHSGGDAKEDWEKIFIQAPESEARVIFYNRFGHNADRVTCTCCGSDYSVTEYESLKEATEYDRKDRFGAGKFGEITVAQYEKSPDVLFIRKKDIKDSERVGDVPVQGYVYL